MNFWGVNENDRPTRLYLELGDPSDGTVLTSMYFLDLRLARRPVFVGAWWTRESIASGSEIEHARYCGQTPTTRSPSCAPCFYAGF